MSAPVLLHADVGRDVGWGHFRECLSIGEALRARGVAAALLVPPGIPEADAEARRLGFAVEHLPEAAWKEAGSLGLVAHLRARGPTYLVSDLFTLTAGYAAAVRPAVSGFANVTELSDEEHAPLNFNICREPRYMPLHARWRDAPQREVRDAVREVLVCFGGADPKNVTGLVLEMLRQGFERGDLPRTFAIRTVVGPLFEHGDAVRALAGSFPVPLEVEGPVDPEALVERARSADLAITTGGGTMYEYCAQGTPSVVVPILDKMDRNAEVLERVGAVVRLARCDLLRAADLVAATRDLLPATGRRELSTAAQRAVDGRGAERIADALEKEWKLA